MSCLLLAESSMYATNLYRDTFAEVLGSGVIGTPPRKRYLPSCHKPWPCLSNSLGPESAIKWRSPLPFYSCRQELELQLPLLAARFACQFSSTISSLISPSGKWQIILPLPLLVLFLRNEKCNDVCQHGREWKSEFSTGGRATTTSQNDIGCNIQIRLVLSRFCIQEVAKRL